MKAPLVKGHVWAKTTEQWQNNSPKGSLVKITDVKDGFIEHRTINPRGPKTYLNEFSFRRMYQHTSPGYSATHQEFNQPGVWNGLVSNDSSWRSDQPHQVNGAHSIRSRG